MLSARGKFLLFADADGATRFRDIEALEKQMALMIASKWVCCKQEGEAHVRYLHFLLLTLFF